MSRLLTVFDKKRIIVQDNFNRADNIATLGNADTGQIWQYLGTWGISSNQAYSTTSSGSNDNYAVIECGRSDVSIQTKMNVIGPGRIMFRVVDFLNYWMAEPWSTGYGIFKRTPGGLTQMAQTTGAQVVGDIVKIRVIGATIELWINGIKVVTLIDSFNQNATKHGIGLYTPNTTLRWDDFSVEEV